MELSLALFIRLLLKGKYVDWIGSCIVACYPCWLVWGGGSGYLEGHWMSPGSNLTTCAAWKLLMVKLNILVAPSIFCVMYLLMMLINWWTLKKNATQSEMDIEKSGASWCCDNILSVDLSRAVLWNLVHALLVNVQPTLLAAETLRWRLADKMVSQKSSTKNGQEYIERPKFGLYSYWAVMSNCDIFCHFGPFV